MAILDIVGKVSPIKITDILKAAYTFHCFLPFRKGLGFWDENRSRTITIELGKQEVLSVIQNIGTFRQRLRAIE